MNIIVIANGSFPIGMASTNRLVSYCKGIVDLGHYVKVIVLCPHEREGDKIKNTQVKGRYAGIDYVYASGTTIWPSGNIRKLFVLVKGLIYAQLITINFARQQKIDVLHFGSGSTKFRYVIPFFILSRIFKAKLTREKSEYPVFELKPNKFSCLYKTIARKYLYKFFDGMMIMTTSLMEYFKQHTRKGAKLILIPMTVEPERFSANRKNTDKKNKFIVYCGYLWGDKDGVDYLVKAFHKVATTHQDAMLSLIGDISNQVEYKKLQRLIDDFGLTSRVIFTGKVARDDMPKLLQGATMLALARPMSLQAQGGFPTKLGEYLATANPVVITKVGDIPLYLTDNETAFLAEPNDVDSFAEKIEFVLSNPDIAEKVGLAGKRLTEEVFNYKYQAKRIMEFLSSF